MPRTCAMCRKPPTEKNPLNRHHVRGRKKGADNTGLIMWVHIKTCHLFAQWVTNQYILRGKGELLRAEDIIYLYNRVVSLRDGPRLELE